MSTVNPRSDLHLGPSKFFVPAKLASNPLVWLCVAGAAFAFIPQLRVFLWNVLSIDGDLQRLLLEFHSFQRRIHFGSGCLIALAAIGLRTLIWYSTSSYRLEGEFLYVNTGLFGRFGSGFFQNFTNTIALGFVVDCDVTRNPIQMIFGLGSLSIKTSDNLTAYLEYVVDPIAARNQLLAGSALRNVRVIATV